MRFPGVFVGTNGGIEKSPWEKVEDGNFSELTWKILENGTSL